MTEVFRFSFKNVFIAYILNDNCQLSPYLILKMSGLEKTYDLKDEAQAKEYIEQIGIEYRYQCYHEKRNDGCHRLGDYLDAFKKEYDKARKVFQKNCVENNYGHSCFKVGNYNFLGKGGEKNHKAAYDFYERGCAAKHAGSCYNAAIMKSHDHDQLGKKDYKKSMEYLEKGCSLGCLKSCYKLSANYIDGNPSENVPPNFKRAFELASKNCEKNHIESCVNMSVMYRTGKGVDKSEELAEKFKKKAEVLHDEMYGTHRTIKFSE